MLRLVAAGGVAADVRCPLKAMADRAAAGEYEALRRRHLQDSPARVITLLREPTHAD